MQVTGAVALENDVEVGRGPSVDVCINEPCICEHHASVHIDDGKYYILDRESTSGTWLNGKRLRLGQRMQLHPGDYLSFGGLGVEGTTYKVKQMHYSQREQGLLSSNTDGSARRYKVSYRDQRTATP